MSCTVLDVSSFLLGRQLVQKLRFFPYYYFYWCYFFPGSAGLTLLPAAACPCCWYFLLLWNVLISFWRHQNEVAKAQLRSHRGISSWSEFGRYVLALENVTSIRLAALNLLWTCGLCLMDGEVMAEPCLRRWRRCWAKWTLGGLDLEELLRLQLCSCSICSAINAAVSDG